MATSVQILKSDIAKLEKAISSSLTPRDLIPQLKEQLRETKDQLNDAIDAKKDLKEKKIAKVKKVARKYAVKKKVKKAKKSLKQKKAKKLSVKGSFEKYLKKLGVKKRSIEFKRDSARDAKPIGWRFKGDNYNKPTKADIAKDAGKPFNKRKTYWEGRQNRGDQYKRYSYAKGGFVTSVSDATASDSLKQELKRKMKKGDPIVSFAFTDYGGDFFDKVAIAYFLENHPKNIVVEDSAYNGQNAIVFGKPAKEFLEEAKDYLLGYENLEDFYYEKEREQEEEDYKRFLNDLEKYDNYKVSEDALDWLLENRSGYYNITTQGLDFSPEELKSKLEEEGLIKKSDDAEYAKGGSVKFKKGDKVRTRQGNIETIDRINKNGNYYTKESDYSWNPSDLTLVSEYAQGGSVYTDNIKKKIYSLFNQWLNNEISDEELVSGLKKNLGSKYWFRYFKGDTQASDWRTVESSLRTKNNRDYLKEGMGIALDENSLELYDNKGNEYKNGGYAYSNGGNLELPSVVKINMDNYKPYSNIKELRYKAMKYLKSLKGKEFSLEESNPTIKFFISEPSIKKMTHTAGETKLIITKQLQDIFKQGTVLGVEDIDASEAQNIKHVLKCASFIMINGQLYEYRFVLKMPYNSKSYLYDGNIDVNTPEIEKTA